MTYRSEVLVAAKALGAAMIHDAAGRRGAFDPAIRQIVPGTVICGPALPVWCHPGDNLGLHQALSQAKTGEIIVADCGGVPMGYWGEVMSVAAQRRGVAGLVIDGGVRDTSALVKIDFGVWARHIAIRGTVKETPGTVGVSVVCGGIVVNSEDLVIADSDGIVSIPSSQVNTILSKAQELHGHEAELLRELNSGKRTTLELLGLSEILLRKMS